MLIEFIEKENMYLFNPANNEYIVNHKGLNTNDTYYYNSIYEYTNPDINNKFDNNIFTQINEKEQNKLNEIGKTLKLTRINE